MRPPNAGESKALRAHLLGDGDERPGVGPKCLCGRRLTCGPAIRDVVGGPRRGQSRERNLLSTWRSVISRMVMDPQAEALRARDLVPSALPSTSRMVGEADRLVPRAGGSADPAVVGTSRMVGDHRGARTDRLVLGAVAMPEAPCPGSLLR